MLSDLPVPSDPRVLADYRDADDAGVFVVGETAIVQTVDFFTPIVDDPFTYGRIAGANAVSDVYAMGGRPITALAIAAFPAKDFPHETIKAIFTGGLSVLAECGVALLGGHTVQDTEVKFGYAVTGLVAPGAVWTNGGAHAGDVLILTKALGTGIIATAAKFDRCDAEVLAGAIASMTLTNRVAWEVLARTADVHACTDVTGFGLAGHACELAAASGVTLRIDGSAVPVLPGALALALGNRTGGMISNTGHFGGRVSLHTTTTPDLAAVFFDPQTSGGLLVSVPAASADRAHHALQDAGVSASVIGNVRETTADATLVMFL